MRTRCPRSLMLSCVAVSLFLASAASAAEQGKVEPPPPADTPNYVTAMLGTTVAYHAPNTAFAGPQKDLSPMVGYGRFLTPKIALELDLGPTFVAGKLSAFTFVPGVVWAFHPNVYAAGRFFALVHPKPNLAAAPGLGFTYAFANNLAPFAEFNAVSVLTNGTPDFGVAATAGCGYAF